VPTQGFSAAYTAPAASKSHEARKRLVLMMQLPVDYWIRAPLEPGAHQGISGAVTSAITRKLPLQNLS
jgi:hypothetical protein